MDKQAQLRQLREKLGEARKDSESILDEANELEGGVAENLKGDLLARFTNSDDEVERLGAAIEKIQRNLDMERADASVVEQAAADAGISLDEHEERYNKAFRNFLRGKKVETSEDRELLEARAQTAGVDTEGGFLVEDTMMNRIIEQLKAFGGVRESVNVISTAKGAALRWPTLDDTANEGELVGELGPVTSEDLVFGEANIGAHVYSSKSIPISWVLMQDSEFDIVSLVTSALVTRLGRITNRHFTTGTGTGQPTGLVTGATSALTAASATAVTYDELLSLVYSLDPAYMNNVGFMFNHTSAGELRKIVDGDGNKAWQPSLKDGEPDRLLGYGITKNQHMPNMEASNAAILFGNFNDAYMVRDVRDVSMIRLDETLAKQLQSEFFGWMRTDGTVINASAYRALTMGV